ncbi:hypothetical protein [Undibacter mobilis]|uniref:Uncharacterized protein n=1 Tax=Undibacter mobilis TaxID=2292256 RepID=A0A371BA59_9BRAD|nr:hypothetical protein [Undibacter mobilis]RDV04505.1 hypothetical protein DXH78_07975 [Undibacter mobilis]
MTKTDIFYRTVALRNFKSQIGYAVSNFNTIIVGLSAVKAGTANKPDDLAVGWSGNKPEYLAMEARHFATKALLVYAVDSLDKYTETIALFPSPISDQLLRDLLLGVPQPTASASTFLPADELAELTTAISNGAPNQILASISKIHSEHGEKRRPAHIRTRLNSLAASFRGSPDYYLAAVRLLVSWRNRHVHQSDEVISETDRSALLQYSGIFQTDHSGTDISLTLQHYEDRKKGPTIKDVSTLVSVLQRVIGGIDERIVETLDLTAYAQSALRQTFKDTANARQRFDSLWGSDRDTRQRKLTVYLRNFGFQPAIPGSKKPGRQLPQQFFDELFNLDKSDAAAYVGLKLDHVD